jgi:hypothetical protein
MRSESKTETRVRQLEDTMGGLNDSLTIGILLILIFGAVAFYLYSKLVQNEKRMSLLENLLVSLKMSTEASLGGPDSVEPISGPLPLHEVEHVSEEDYADLLKDIPAAAPGGGEQKKEGSVSSVPSTNSVSGRLHDNEGQGQNLAQGVEEADVEADAEALLRSIPSSSASQVDANYESMTLKELQALAKQRGLSGVAQRKRDLIDALKRQGLPAPAAPMPLDQSGAFPLQEAGISLEEM